MSYLSIYRITSQSSSPSLTHTLLLLLLPSTTVPHSRLSTWRFARHHYNALPHHRALVNTKHRDHTGRGKKDMGKKKKKGKKEKGDRLPGKSSQAHQPNKATLAGVSSLSLFSSAGCAPATRIVQSTRRAPGSPLPSHPIPSLLIPSIPVDLNARPHLAPSRQMPRVFVVRATPDCYFFQNLQT